MKCTRETCNYLIHPEKKNNGGTHCCNTCKESGSHGEFCKRGLYKNPLPGTITTTKATTTTKASTAAIKKPIKITVVGTKQSGSTRLFNLLIMLYEYLGKKVFSTYHYMHGKDEQYDVIISKWHNAEIKDLGVYDFVLSPIRHLLDCAISAKKRCLQMDMKKSCYHNIDLFNKFEDIADMIFVYEKYNLNYVKELCEVLKIKINDDSLTDIIHKLDELHNSKSIVRHDDRNSEQFRRTLLSQDHNTSGGKSNKFLTEMTKEEVDEFLNDKKIHSFLKKLNYL
jgi:hypothetical protein